VCQAVVRTFAKPVAMKVHDPFRRGASARQKEAMWVPPHAFQRVRGDGSKVSEPLVMEDNIVNVSVRQFKAPAGSRRRRPSYLGSDIAPRL